MAKLKTWTIDEYYKEMKAYFSDQQKSKVIKIITLGFSGAYQYWIPASLMTFDKFADIYWNFEPLMQRYFNSKDEMMKELNKNDILSAYGFVVRWLFRDSEIIYQLGFVSKNVESWVEEYKDAKKDEYLMGIKMDPFTYTGKIPTRKDGSGSEYIDTKSPDFKVDSNYRVFWEEIDTEQFLKEEALYIDPAKHNTYKDDIQNADWSYKSDIKKFVKKHTNFKIENDDE